MSGMFFRAENFNRMLGNWVLHPNVNLTEMLDRSGIDCKNYSQTLINWRNNPTTPNNKILGVTFMNYGLHAATAVNFLSANKGWGFSGHDFLEISPDFALTTTYCQGSIIPPLPSFSSEGITGSWSPPLNNNVTTTYTFTPNPNQCSLAVTKTIAILPASVPTGNSIQSFTTNSTLQNIIVNPTNVVWFANSADAQANTNALSNTTALVNGATYFAVSSNGTCRSQALAVTIQINLSTISNNFALLKIFPNPTTAEINISNGAPIKQIDIVNNLGQLILRQNYNSLTINLDLSTFPKASYFLKIITEQSATIAKVVKH